jgi:hypothetical protein
MSTNWSDHFEHRLTLDHAGSCRGKPEYPGGCDQRAFCADGCISFNDGDFHLPVGKLAEFVATLYGTAGLPAPVILERPEIIPDGDGETGINIFTVRAEPHLGSLSIRYHGAPSAAVIAPGPARVLASVIAAYADAAEAGREFDPAEVEELAEVLREHGDCASLRWDAARAALRWFRGKQQRQGPSDG